MYECKICQGTVIKWITWYEKGLFSKNHLKIEVCGLIHLNKIQKVNPKHTEINIEILFQFSTTLFLTSARLDFMNLSLSELSSYSEDFNLIEIGLSSQSHFVVLMARFSYGCAEKVYGHTVQTDSLWLSPCSYQHITVFWIMEEYKKKKNMENGDASVTVFLKVHYM